jgi:hypothetical protein
MDTTLQGLLTSIDAGDFQAVGVLADYLEEHGDPRAALALATAQIQPEEIAHTLGLLRAGQESAAAPVAASALETFLIGWPLTLPNLNVNTSISHKDCLRDVLKALRQDRAPADVYRASALTRRAKAKRLLDQFRETPST